MYILFKNYRNGKLWKDIYFYKIIIKKGIKIVGHMPSGPNVALSVLLDISDVIKYE